MHGFLYSREEEIMEDQLISFETMKLASEKGFNFGHSIFCYEMEPSEDFKEIFIPDLNLTISHEDWSKKYKICTQSLLQKWLLEVHDIHIEILLKENNLYKQFYFRIIYNIYYDSFYHDKFEQAMESALQTALNLIEMKKPAN